MPTHRKFEERLADFAGQDGCWLWHSKREDTGYARVKRWENGIPRHYYAHCLAYEILVGPVPEGFELDHLCRVRHCVNPAHLEVVTHKVNMERATLNGARLIGGIASGLGHYLGVRDSCINGHPYVEGSYKVVNDRGRTARICRHCARERTQRYRDKQKVA